MKRLYSLCTGLMLCAISFAQTFTSVFEGQTLYFQVLSSQEQTVALVAPPKGKYKGEIYKIPTNVQYSGIEYIVIEIGDKAFNKCKKLQTVILPESLKTIGIQAFYQCPMITQIQFPDGLEEIMTQAFAGTRLERIEIPSTVKIIGALAFFSFNKTVGQPTRIKWISIPNSVEEIGDHAFNRFVNGYGAWKASKCHVASLPEWVTDSEAKRIGIHEDSYQEYKNKQ